MDLDPSTFQKKGMGFLDNPKEMKILPGHIKTGKFSDYELDEAGLKRIKRMAKLESRGRERFDLAKIIYNDIGKEELEIYVSSKNVLETYKNLQREEEVKIIGIDPIYDDFTEVIIKLDNLKGVKHKSMMDNIKNKLIIRFFELMSYFPEENIEKVIDSDNKNRLSTIEKIIISFSASTTIIFVSTVVIILIIDLIAKKLKKSR